MGNPGAGYMQKIADLRRQIVALQNGGGNGGDNSALIAALQAQIATLTGQLAAANAANDTLQNDPNGALNESANRLLLIEELQALNAEITANMGEPNVFLVDAIDGHTYLNLYSEAAAGGAPSDRRHPDTHSLTNEVGWERDGALFFLVSDGTARVIEFCFYNTATGLYRLHVHAPKNANLSSFRYTSNGLATGEQGNTAVPSNAPAAVTLRQDMGVNLQLAPGMTYVKLRRTDAKQYFCPRALRFVRVSA